MARPIIKKKEQASQLSIDFSITQALSTEPWMNEATEI